MKKILTTFVKYPFYANIIIAFAILAGGLSLYFMKKSFFPERKSRFINVSVSYPGASPKEMEEGVTSIIEESIRGIVGIKEITSNSSENFAQVRIETTGEYDLDETLTEVKNAVDGISSFPVDAEKPTVYKVRTTTPAARLGLSGDVDLLTLKKYANEIEEDFLASGIISQINIGGYPALEISVEVPEENLLRYNLTIDQISQAISQNNRDFAAGQIKSDKEEILIRSRSRTVDPNLIGNIILRANVDGSYLRIRNVANVKLQFADVSSGTLMNGKQGVFLAVQKLAEEDLEEIVKYIEKYKDEFNEKHSNVQLALTFNFLDLLQSRLNLLINNGSYGLVLVVLSLAFFLSFRLSLWVAWGIPSSFMMMFVVANMLGVTINMISLFGMILVVGILVDDGIVIAENIFTHFEMGKSPKRAAIDGAMEVKGAVITSVTTTIVAFMPLLFLEGNMEIMKEMAIIVVISLGFSLLEAFFVLPPHLSSPHILRVRNKKTSSGKVREKTEAVIALMRDKIYGTALKEIIRWRWIVVVVPISLILITMGMIRGTIIRTTFFPAVTFDFFSLDIAFTPGSGEKQTWEFLQKFDENIWEVNSELEEEFADTNTFITYTFVSVGGAFNGNESGAHAGNIFVLLRDMEGAPLSSFDIVKRIKNKIGEVPEASKFTVGGVQRFGKPISVSLLSRNLQELDMAKEFFIDQLRNMSQLKNVTDNNALGKQEILLKLKPKAYYLGLTQAQISTQVRQGFYGDQVQRLQSGKDEIRVWVRYPKDDRINVGKLENMKIKTAKGEYPLTELVTYTVERGPVNIQRYNGSREVRVEADLLDPFDPVPPILENINQEIIPQIKSKFPGIKIEYQGQQRGSNEAMAEILKYFGIAFAVILLILILHFRSFSQMILTIMMIPMSFLGAAWGHGIHGHPISILSAWGMVALSGVVINDAVVFLTKFNQLLLTGEKVDQAAFNAGIQRFRAIMLTTITTVLGLFPLIMEKSFQAQFLIPMSISLAYGVLIGTGFILLFLPVLVLTLNDTKVFIKNKIFGKNVKPEDVEPVVIYSRVNID